MPVEIRSSAHFVLQAQRRDRQDADAVLVDQERVLVGAVDRPAVLDDAQPPRGHLVDHAMVEQDHAIGDVLFQAVPGQRALAALAGDDGGDALVLEPAEQAAQLGPQDARVRQAAEQRLDGVQHDPLGPDGVDGVAEADEQPFEVVVAGFLDLAALDAHEIHDDLLLLDQLVEVEAERADVLRQLLGGFLEGHEHARLVVLRGPAHQELHRQQRLAAARRCRRRAWAGRAADRRR